MKSGRFCHIRLVFASFIAYGHVGETNPNTEHLLPRTHPVVYPLTIQQQDDMKAVEEYAAIMKPHSGRSVWAGSCFDGKAANDCLSRLGRLARSAPDTATKAAFEALADQIAGYQLRFLLPHGAGRKLLMLCEFVFGAYGIMSGHVWCGIFIVIALTSSPRIAGEVAGIRDLL